MRPPLRRLAIPSAVIAAIVLAALMTPLLPLADPVRMEVAARLSPPSPAHLLGQDEYGRDVLARIVWGARVSLSVAFASALIAAAIGTLLGLLGGYFRGLVELVTVRPAEAVLCFPPLLLALLVVTLMGAGAATLIVALSILFAPGFARVAYAETLAVRPLDYVTAQVALGAPSNRILRRTLLPNIAPPLLVQFSLTVAAALVLESGLSFLGLGVVPPAPSWGLMIRGARGTMEQAPWLLVWPCLALTGTVLALNALCDALRDVLDPRRAPAAARTAGPAPARRESEAAASAGPALLAVQGLALEVGPPESPIRPVRDVSLDVAPGGTLALVGESGSGKTLTGLAVLGLLPPEVRIAEGQIPFRTRDGTVVDLAALPEPERRRLRGGDIAMVFQDPSSSLDPVHRVGDQVAEALEAHGAPSREAERRAVALLARVGLPDPARRARAFPHELSGGQRQRVMIAAAIANGPRLLVADEPTTALDVTIQAQILDLFADLKRQERGMGLIFITHNLALVAEIADRVAVMYAGLVVEDGPVEAVFAQPRHPYTAALLASVPEGDARALTAIPGTVPPPHAVPPGCPFAPRCAHAARICVESDPLPEMAEPGHATRCVRWREVT